ncbi:unnamed protein product [Sphagnum balticum]
MLGVPDALVPLEIPMSQIGLLLGETTAVWMSVDVPPTQPPGVYTGEIAITAVKLDADGESRMLESGNQKRTAEFPNASRGRYQQIPTRVVDHPKADEYYGDMRLAVYAVPYAPVLSSSETAKEVVRRELEILKTKDHWKKAYFYLWDELVGLDQHESIQHMAEEITGTAPYARVLTTYYCVGAAQEKATETPNAAEEKGGDYQRTADLTSNQVKQNASGFLGTAQDKANETAGAAEEKSKQAKDSATCTWNSTKDKASNIAATAFSHRSSKHKKQRRQYGSKRSSSLPPAFLHHLDLYF